MKKSRPLIILVAIAIALTSLSPFVFASDFEGYIAISTKEQLDTIRFSLSQKFYLTNDIDLEGEQFTPIGSETAAFTGIFDGNGYTIKNLNVNITEHADDGYVYGGLFAYTEGTVKNLSLENVNVNVSVNVKGSLRVFAAGIAAYNKGTIENCTVSGAITSFTRGAAAYAGGIAGESHSGVVKNCKNFASVTASVSSRGQEYASRCGMSGGVVGSAYYTSVSDCTNNGIVNVGDTTEHAYAGGITGTLNYGSLKNCTNTASVTGIAGYDANVGGISGDNYYANFDNSINSGVVYGNANNNARIGGIVGNSTYGIKSCKNTATVTAVTKNQTAYTGGIVGQTINNVRHCQNTGSVTVTASGVSSYIGGVVGFASGKLVEKSSNTASVSGTDSAGGIVGFSETNIKNCYNSGKVSASNQAGGITGYASSGKTVANCYSAGSAFVKSSSGCAGGIVGRNMGAKLSFCLYSDSNTAGSGSGEDGCSKNTLDKLSKQSTYIGFDFKTVWIMDSTTDYAYPELRTADNIILADSSAQFSDVSTDSWFKQYTDYAYTFGVIKGVTDTDIKPNNNMTRAQFVQVLANLEGIDTSNTQTDTMFSDVKSGSWYAPAVKWASENSIVNGVSSDKFNPSGNITREQMCTMLVRYSSYVNITLDQVNESKTFADDAQISDYAKDSVYKCQRAGIVDGVTATEFKPKNLASRAQVATVMSRYHQSYML